MSICRDCDELRVDSDTLEEYCSLGLPLCEEGENCDDFWFGEDWEDDDDGEYVAEIPF